ncbi:MAG: EF-P beta-lysylation protein EpmB [Wenzhouxiangellaceae bacterium]
MVARTTACSQQLPWRQELRRAIKTPAELLRAVGLDEQIDACEAAHQQFATRVPWPYAQRIRQGDRHDPLLLQVLPVAEETAAQPGYSSDPVGDLASRRSRGLLHKYQGRVLLIATGACAINCRYCFRREFPYQDETAASGRFRAAIEYIAAHSDVHEVILSGGDPLLLGTDALQQLTDALSAIPHLRRLRIHTRLPVVLPSRVTERLLSWSSALPWPLSVVIHCNHPREIDQTVSAALQRWRQAGATLLNQAVLLRGVNDDARIQAELSETLYASGVLPYYLNLLDRVRGSAHFAVERSQAQAIMEQLRRSLSGYLVPRLVQEEPGAPYKVPIL